MAQQVVISFNANANFSDLIGEVRRANAEIGVLQSQLNGLGSSSYGSLNNLNNQFIEGMRNSRLWSSTFVDVTNETREFGRHLDQGRLKLKDYFREFNTQVRGQRGMIRRLAEEQVKLQRSILTTTVGPQGETRNILSTPTGLDRLDPSTMKALRAEQFKIIGRAVQGVSTELINLGKNTQWAGRQLTVGLTVPLTIFASQAAMAFKEVDQQLTRLAKVYGDIGGATTSEIAAIKKETSDLARSLAESMGASATETIGLAADIAATGKTGTDLLQSVAETTRLAVLGEVDRQEAMSATLSLQSAFNLNTKELAESINFLNAVENQTSTSLQDLVTAIPKAGPVVRQLGGDVQDLALFLTAMREGGINASEGANALKSGLASIINPTQKTRELMNGFGIDIQNIVNSNAGDLVGTVTALKDALNTLNPLARAQAIEQIFGKFQFARMSALFDNLGEAGSQTVQVMKLMGASTADLAAIADRELKTLTESASGRFQRQMETLKANMALAGEGFLGLFSKVLSGLNKVLEGFNSLPDGAKTVLTIIGAIVGLAGPLIMLSGVFLNFIGYITKSIGFLGRLFTGTKKFEMLDEQLVAVNLSGEKLSNTLYDQAGAARVAEAEVSRLIQSLIRLTEVQETSSSGAVNADMQGRGYIPSMIFDAKEGRMPGGSEFSHFKTRGYRKQLEAQFGISQPRAEMLKTLGVNIPSMSMAAKLQSIMGQAMPSTLVDDNTTAEEMQSMVANAANTKRRKAAFSTFMQESKDPGKELRSLFTTKSDYAAIQSKHIANMKIISLAYEKSSEQGSRLAKEVQAAIEANGPEAGIQRIRQYASEIGINYNELVDSYGREIILAFDTAGPEGAISTAVKSEIQAVGAKFDQLEIKTQQALFSLSNEMAQGAVYLDTQSKNAAVKVDTGTKRLGTVTVALIDGVVQVISGAGNVLTGKGVMNNPKIKAAIEQLRVAEQKLETSTAVSIQESAVAMETAAQAASPDGGAAGSIGPLRRAKNGMRGIFTGKAGLGSSMAMMGLGMATTMLPTGGAGNIAGGAMMGASMGMMFGAPGAAVGAALGALVPAIKMTIDYFKKLADIQALSIKQYQIDKEYAAAAGLNLKTIGDIQLTQITGKSQEAASALEMLAKAALDAETATSTGALREKTKGAGTFADVKEEFKNQYLSYIAAGASEETAKQMMAAILKAAGKEGFATDLKMMLSGLSGTTQSGATNKMLMDSMRAGSVSGTAFEKALNQDAFKGMDKQTLIRSAAYGTTSGYYGDQAAAMQELITAYKDLNSTQKDYVLNNKLAAIQTAILNDAMANQSAAVFAETMKQAAESGGITADTVDKVADSISGLAPLERTVLEGLQRNGVESSDVLLALKMRIEGVIPSLEAVKDFDGMKIRAYFQLYQANEELTKAKSDLKSSIEAMYAGGGTTGNNDAAKKAIQAQLDALEEIERKERNINKLKELSIKYEEKRRALAADYITAISNGDMEGALRAQIEMERESAAFAREKAQTQKEIARDDQKKALQDKLKGLDSASSSAGKVANKAKELETNVNDAISSVVSGFSKDGKMTASFDEFIKSEAFSGFESRWKGVLSSEAMNDAMDTLKKSFKQLEAQLAELNAGTTIGVGTYKAPRDITGYAQGLGIARAGGNNGVANALSDPQRDKLIEDFATSGQAVEGEYVTIFGEKYQLKTHNGKLQLIRHEPAKGKWMGGKVGYSSGGLITGPGNGVSDSIVAKFAQGGAIRVSNGEFIQSARAVNYYGLANMEKLNNRLVSPSVFEGQSTSTSGNGDVNVTIGNINITEPGCTPDEIIAKIKKDLGAAVKRTTDMRYMSV